MLVVVEPVVLVEVVVHADPEPGLEMADCRLMLLVVTTDVKVVVHADPELGPEMAD